MARIFRGGDSRPTTTTRSASRVLRRRRIHPPTPTVLRRTNAPVLRRTSWFKRRLFHDGRRARRIHDAGWRVALGLCREAFDGAAECSPAEWSYKCYGAKVARKLGAPAADVFARLAATTKCAPGNLEAFYQLHTTRVKLLLRLKRGKNEEEEEEKKVLSLVAEHSFDPAAVQSGGTTWDALWLDAAAAVRACSKIVPGYHKAHYRLAWMRLKHPVGAVLAAAAATAAAGGFYGDIDGSRSVCGGGGGSGGSCNFASWSVDTAVASARDALQPLFKTSDGGGAGAANKADMFRVGGGGQPKFTVNIWEIDDYNLSVTSGKNRRGAALGSFRLATVGINESARKYVAAVRRATRPYLSLCFAAGDLSPLVAAPAHIGASKFSTSMADLRLLALGLAVQLWLPQWPRGDREDEESRA